ncbi:MAG: hypothetical protein HY293_02845 [Planctomycetes bacterium]|nr:hypothetical protein [Planctomycetota bacterium]
MAKKLLILVLLAGCSDPEPRPAKAPLSPLDRELQEVRDTLYRARTVRVRFRGEWPWAVARMPREVTGTVLLGTGEKAKVSLAISFAPGSAVTYEAVCDGTRLWRSPNVEAENFNPGPTGLRRLLLQALAWHGVGWSFPHGTRPKTIGQGYVVCDLIPQERDWNPSRVERGDINSRVINHLCPDIDYRVRLSFDPSTNHLRKREMIGDKGAVWYVETYLEVERNAAIPDDEFRIPGQ